MIYALEHMWKVMKLKKSNSNNNFKYIIGLFIGGTIKIIIDYYIH